MVDQLLLALTLVASEPPAPLTITNRLITQEQGSWRIDYRLHYDHPVPVTGDEAVDVRVKVEGWVSNSRVPSHTIPKFSTLDTSMPMGLSVVGDVVQSSNEAQRCQERLAMRIDFVEDYDAPGQTILIQLRLEHKHFLHGDYDPLLGRRTVEIRLGQHVVRDVVPMDREQYLALPKKSSWPAPPEERRDKRHYVSAPDSLHLEAHVPGNQYYRFPERPVRYGTRMRLRFWYLIANGTEGECRARIAQYKDTPTAWKVLSEGAHEVLLTKVGRWVKVERVFRTEPDATTIALDFRICDPNNTNIGEMWIDDASLEPVLDAVKDTP